MPSRWRPVFRAALTPSSLDPLVETSARRSRRKSPRMLARLKDPKGGVRGAAAARSGMRRSGGRPIALEQHGRCAGCRCGRSAGARTVNLQDEAQRHIVATTDRRMPNAVGPVCACSHMTTPQAADGGRNARASAGAKSADALVMP